MKNLYFIVFIISSLFACKSKEDENNNNGVAVSKNASATQNMDSLFKAANNTGKSNVANNTAQISTPNPVSTTQNLQPTNSNVPLPQQIQQPTVLQPVQTNTQNTSGLNPAHGQPGHKCEIAVGAPLNSTPTKMQTSTNVSSKASNPVATTSPTMVTTQQAVPQTVAKGMNPAHGQPGHKCEIAVGAPLDSKPTAPTAPKTIPYNPSVINMDKAKQ